LSNFHIFPKYPVTICTFNFFCRLQTNLKICKWLNLKISCVIEDKYTELAVRVLHDAFQFDREER